MMSFHYCRQIVQAELQKTRAICPWELHALLVAQLSNQDINNTVDNTEFISQMAQFSMIQAISDLSQQSQAAYSVSLIGKAANLLLKII